MDKQTLETYEPKLARLFYNSRKNNRFSSAYILYGPKNAPLKEIAFYLAQSLECEKELFACNNCPSCQRFINGVRPDFTFIDGQNELIKKGDIQNLENKFSLSAIEKGHSLVYIINKVENINNEAANSLLKFLEEPKAGQIAFLTSNNLDKILPTIRSRSIAIRIDPINSKQLQKELENHEFIFDNEGKKQKSIRLSSTEAYILARNFSSISDVEALLKEDNSFSDGFSAAESFLNDLIISNKTACFTLLKETSRLKDSKCYNWMYSTIQEVFDDVLLNDTEDNPFAEIISSLQSKKKQIAKGNNTIKDILSHRYLNYNPTLSVARFLTSLDERK